MEKKCPSESGGGDSDLLYEIKLEADGHDKKLGIGGGGCGDVAVACSSSKRELGGGSSNVKDAASGSVVGAGSGSSTPPGLNVSEPLHPMNNPMILRLLFERCPSQLLAKLRLVSKQWYDLSLPTWRSSFPVKFTLNAAGEIFVKDTVPLEKFLEYVDNPVNRCDTIPYRFIKLQKWTIAPNNARIENFWRLFGNTVTTLELYQCTFTEVEELRKVIYKCFPDLTKLYLNWCTLPEASSNDKGVFRVAKFVEPAYGEHPHLKLLSITSGSFEFARLPVSWLELFSHFQSLTSLTVPGGLFQPGLPDSHVNEILYAIRVVRHHNQQKLRLERLDFGVVPTLSWDEDSKEKFPLLEQLQIPLQSFWVDVDPDLDELSVKNILEFHAKTLRRVVACQADQPIGSSEFWQEVYGIRSNIPSEPSLWNFPLKVEVTHLQDLEMVDVLPEDLAFLKYTTGLRKLDIRETLDLFGSTQMVSNTLAMSVNLKLFRVMELRLDYVLTEMDIITLIEWMPNVEKLKMILNDKHFSIVCGGWGNLKGMEVLGNELTDMGVTGQVGGPYHQQRAEDLPPIITHLLKLEGFGFHCKKLTDASFFQGFLLLPKLKQLHVCSKKALRLGTAKGRISRCLEEKNIGLLSTKLWN